MGISSSSSSSSSSDSDYETQVHYRDLPQHSRPVTVEEAERKAYY